MLKHLMSGSSLLAIALRDTENDNGADAKIVREIEGKVGDG